MTLPYPLIKAPAEAGARQVEIQPKSNVISREMTERVAYKTPSIDATSG